jgi:hypothetical protein
MRAAGGTDAVLRYAWKTQPTLKKLRWADSARSLAHRTGAPTDGRASSCGLGSAAGSTDTRRPCAHTLAADLTAGGMTANSASAASSSVQRHTQQDAVFDRAPAAQLAVRSNGHHRASVGIPQARSPESVSSVPYLIPYT